MNIVEQLTATSQQLQDAGLGRDAADAIASAIVSSQEENGERMSRMELAIEDLIKSVKTLSDRMAEQQKENSERMNKMELAITEMSKSIKALGEKMVEHQIATEQKIADAQIATEKKIADAKVFIVLWVVGAITVAAGGMYAAVRDLLVNVLSLG